MRIISDGTQRGTIVYDDDGYPVTRVVAIQRKGGKWYVTRGLARSEVDATIESVPDDEDFFLALNDNYQPVRVG